MPAERKAYPAAKNLTVYRWHLKNRHHIVPTWRGAPPAWLDALHRYEATREAAERIVPHAGPGMIAVGAVTAAPTTAIRLRPTRPRPTGHRVAAVAAEALVGLAEPHGPGGHEPVRRSGTRPQRCRSSNLSARTLRSKHPSTFETSSFAMRGMIVRASQWTCTCC